ncbi:Rcs stress response system protein RcsF [Providencia sneebia]|uniref:Outer membrane lipoprotein RcsF n=1 Tax=Providencia sneebia DSM 19967 TaxID=1141660 RepID=K8W0S8_9GAMM|nr:Rcs stress response system protein RcsF [Providencia sneebia]EKT53396.1 outer membrane lipoprotein [Providencia sneebia DSM 19967]
MRLLLPTLMIFVLTGCGMNQQIYKNQNKGFSSMKLSKPVTQKKAKEKKSNVKLMNSPEELLGMPFRDLGIVSGESCRANVQSPPASVTTAKNSMLVKAAYIAADAVLLHQCQTLTYPGCFQATICEGSAVQIIN